MGTSKGGSYHSYHSYHSLAMYKNVSAMYIVQLCTKMYQPKLQLRSQFMQNIPFDCFLTFIWAILHLFHPRYTMRIIKRQKKSKFVSRRGDQKNVRFDHRTSDYHNL